MSIATPRYSWTFFRAGGLDQARIERAADYRSLSQLDLKLWVALSCPIKGLEFDSRTLQLLDVDQDQRVRAAELIAAVEWCCAVLKDPGDLHHGRDGLPLAAINDHDETGKALLDSARHLLASLGKEGADRVEVADTSDSAKLFANTVFNGDGIITADSAKDAETRQLIQDIIDLKGSVIDRSGKPGIDKARADAFFALCEIYVAWWDAGAGLHSMGDATSAAYTAFAAVKGKIADYFLRCRLAGYDQRAAGALNRAEQDYIAFAAKDLSIDQRDIVALHLQHVAPDKALQLTLPVNPAWAAAIASFSELVVRPLLGAATISIDDAQWGALCSRMAPYEAWQGAKKGAEVEKFGIDLVRSWATAGKGAVDRLIAQDLAVANQVAGFDSIERLVRYYRDLGHLVRNFVNFSDFYDPSRHAIFQIGTLYLDQRSCDLCLRVEDAAAHVAIGSMGKMYMVYCACARAGGQKMNIVACVTQGDGDYLMPGRNGVFYDRQGRDWDATITKIIDNPISIRQAFWSPYKKFVRFIEEQVAKRAATADADATAKLQGVAASAAEAAAAGKAPKEKPKFDVGMLAAMSVGLGAIGALLGGAISGFLGLGTWMPLGLLGIMLLISGPSVLIAFIKLRQRTLGPLLEGNGWAINGRVKINIPLGTALTAAKELPAGARRLLQDPFEDKDAQRRRRNMVLVLIVAVILGAGWWYREWLREVWIHRILPLSGFGYDPIDAIPVGRPEPAILPRAPAPTPATVAPESPTNPK